MRREPRFLDYSYNYFYSGCKFLYLGAATKNRHPGADYYANMLSHLRGDYAVFHYRKMWLNYIKKINLVKRLYSSRSDLFFATNRYEHLALFKKHSVRSRAAVLYYGRSGQFTEWFTKLDMPRLLEKTSSQLGAPSGVTGSSYIAAQSRVLFTLSDAPRDRIFLKELTAADDLLCFSPGDVGSLYAGSHFIPLFGNSASFSSWCFFMNIFAKCAGRPRAPLRRGPGTRFGVGPVKYYCRPDDHSRGERAFQSAPFSARGSRTTRSTRAFVIARASRLHEARYDADGGAFVIKKTINFVK